MEPLTVGIMPKTDIRQRMMAIARGDLKPEPGDPKVWFTSMRALAGVLNDDNLAVLRVMAETEPESISDLAVTTGLDPERLARTLGTLAGYGIVDLRHEQHGVRPVAKTTEFRILIA
jgi:predicted transcriptional regulator